MRTLLYHWVKTNRVMLVNAGSLVGTTTVTSVLGFAYWWLAARQFSPEAVGLASAAISAMTLLGTGCILGLGTLLVGELPRQQGKEVSLISAALILVGGVGGCFGVVFAVVAPFISTDFQPLGASIQDIMLFAIGVSLTAITIVLDQAVIGLLRGELQLWRNILFSLVKLAALFVAGLWLFHRVGMAIYATWAIGNALSLAALAGFAGLKGGWRESSYLPEWGLLRKLGPVALQHHVLNLILRAPTLALPVLVTVLLSVTMNAWFYVSFMIANFVFSIPVALTTVLYATNSAEPAELTHKARLTLGLSAGASVLATCVFLFGTKQVLGLFGHIYAEQAAWSLRILALGAFPLIIKNHYVAVCRIHDRMVYAILPIAIGGLLELGAAALGAHLGGLSGLSLGWIIALCIELVFMVPAVYKAVRPTSVAFKEGTEMSKVPIRPQLASVMKILNPLDTIGVLLPICVFFLWTISLKYVNVRQMTDLGLVSVLSPLTITALIILTMSFCLALRQFVPMRTPILLLHLALLIFMLYGITTLVEEAPRFAVVYRHAGYTEYIMRTGTVDPNLDAYFNWPGFFMLSAFLTRVAGYHDILGYAAWAPVFLNLIYLGPLYMIFTSATADKRLVWLGLWFFYLTNWIGQDYFSPQGLNFFMYLVIIAILLKWFRVPTPMSDRQSRCASGVGISFNGTSSTQPGIGEQQRKQLADVLDKSALYSRLVHRFREWLNLPDTLGMPLASIQPRQHIALLAIIIIVFAFVVFSHPLTPFFVLASVIALIVFRRCTPFWLPILMAAMTGVWIMLMTQPFLAGHLDWVTGGFGNISSAFSANVTNRVGGSLEHSFIEKIRVIMTLFVWGLAFVGAVRRLRKGYHDLSYMLLAIVPFPLLVAQPYGGEMLLRIYLFSLPTMAFFAASIFYPTVTTGRSRWMTAAVAGISIVLLGGFLFTRYGNERMDYMTNAEVAGVHYLYSIAQPDSIFIEGSDGVPWQLQDFEKHDVYSLTDKQYNAVATSNVDAIVQFIESTKHSQAYVIFTRSEKATAESAIGLPRGALDRLEKALIASGKFKLVYSNSDAQVLIFVDEAKGGGL